MTFTASVFAIPVHALRAGVLAAAAPSRDISQEVAYLLIALIAIAVLGLGAWGANSWVRRRRYDSHAGLFIALCRAHGLDRRSRLLLRQLARQHQLARPGRLFTEPDLLDPARLGQNLRARSGEIVALRTSLFLGEGGLAEADSSVLSDSPSALV